MVAFAPTFCGFLDDATIEAAVNYGRPIELPPQPPLSIKAFVDASGGRHDHYTLAVGTQGGERIVIDVCAALRRRSIRRKRPKQYRQAG